MISTASRRRIRRVSRALAVTVGWSVIIVALDFGLGTLWTRWSGTEETATRQAAVVVEGQIPRDPRADSPALAGYPWAEDYLDELQLQRYGYRPYVIGDLKEVAGEYINSGDGTRRSYEPPGVDGGDVVEIWFFGGSTMFGEGQRDEYTIPSQVARLAEADGITVRPINFGHQGQLLWQEMLRFEFELADRGRPDLAVFYDGLNEFNLQLADGTGQPTHDSLEVTADRLSGNGAPLPTAVPLRAAVWDRYEETSLIGKLVDRMGSLATTRPAGALPSGVVDDQPRVESEEFVADVSDVYARSVDMARLIAAEANVVTAFFWQPIGGENLRYDVVADHLPAGVVDVSTVLDDAPGPVYIDGGHTNELGAEIVAEEIYRSIGPQIAAAAERSTS